MRPPFVVGVPRMPRIPRVPRGRYESMYDEVREMFRSADDLARQAGSAVSADHILLAVLRSGPTSGASVLRDLGITEGDVAAPAPGGSRGRRVWGPDIPPIIPASGGGARAAGGAPPERGPPPKAETAGSATGGIGQAFFTVDQAAQFLGIHHQTLRGYIKGGKLPAYRLAGEKVLRIKREDLMELLELVLSTDVGDGG